MSLTALGWILHRLDVPRLATILTHTQLAWVAGALALFGISFALAAGRWHLILRLSRCHVHAGATYRTVLVGHLFNTILFGPTGGDIAKAALYSRWYGFATSSILATCLLDRFVGGLGFLAFVACTPSLALYSGQLSQRLERLLASPILLFGVAGGLGLILAAHLVRRRWAGPSLLHRIAAALGSNASQLLRQPRLALSGVFLAALSHFCISCVFLFCLKAVTRTPFSMGAVLWTVPVISMITSAPITFAGTGLREGAALFFFRLYGIPDTDAVAASLLVLFIYLAWAAVGAIFFWRGEARHNRAEAQAPQQSISVVVPTLNEAEALPAAIVQARNVPEVLEIIVVDAGSSDETQQIAQALGCMVFAGPRSRGGQLRLGAQHARGDVILLLHADTWLPPDAGQAVRNCLRDPLVVGGGFWKVFRQRNPLMVGSRFRCALRLWVFGRILGDQAMFIRRTALHAIGGVPDVPLMEEFELCWRLRRLGRLALAGATVSTSARRFAKLGTVRTYLRMWHVTTRYYLGAPAHKLREIYEKE